MHGRRSDEVAGLRGRQVWRLLRHKGRRTPVRESGGNGVLPCERFTLARDQHQAGSGGRGPTKWPRAVCSTTDNHGYRRLACRRPIKQRRTTHGYRVNLGPAGGELQDFRPDFSRPLLPRPCGFIDSSQPAIFATSARCPKTEEPERRSPASWDRTGTGFGGERRLDSAGDLWWVASEGYFSSISLPLDASSAPADLRRRFNRENPEALEQMRQADRDAEGAVELRS
jgi:hypothetical protein